jgi:hypothetical protein
MRPGMSLSRTRATTQSRKLLADPPDGQADLQPRAKRLTHYHDADWLIDHRSKSDVIERLRRSNVAHEDRDALVT